MDSEQTQILNLRRTISELSSLYELNVEDNFEFLSPKLTFFLPKQIGFKPIFTFSINTSVRVDKKKTRWKMGATTDHHAW